MIEVKRTADGDPMMFEVAVKDASGASRHAVTMAAGTYRRLSAGGRHTPEQCIEAAFRFLLDREPKEAILGRFDVTQISHYFPAFEDRLPDYLAGG